MLSSVPHQEEARRETSGSVQRCPSGPECSLPGSPRRLRLTLCSRCPACWCVFTWAPHPHRTPGTSAGRQSLSAALPSCGSREHQAGAAASGRQAAAETAGSWRRGSAPPHEDSPFFLIRSGPGGEGPGEERAEATPPQIPGPPQPSPV